ncbi:hypothetical protein Tco_1410400 [Tanacetum coccineum]
MGHHDSRKYLAQLDALELYLQLILMDVSNIRDVPDHQENTCKQGVYGSLYRDIMVGYGKWEFDPCDLSNPWPNNSGAAHIWQGYEDKIIPYKVNQFLSEKLPFVRYHEIPVPIVSQWYHLITINCTWDQQWLNALQQMEYDIDDILNDSTTNAMHREITAAIPNQNQKSLHMSAKPLAPAAIAMT